MLEIPQKTFNAPPPIPVPAARAVASASLTEPGAPVEDRPWRATGGSVDDIVYGPPPLPASQTTPSTDKVAVASTVCGATAFIPIISQLIGLALGVWALLRIRRAGRDGRKVRGRGWAVTGLMWNGFVLLGWVALFGIFAGLSGTLSQTNHKLGNLTKNSAAHRKPNPAHNLRFLFPDNGK